MKNIYIATDSRGYIGPVTAQDPTARKTSWTEMFRAKYPDHNYIMRRSAAEIPTHFLYDCYGLEQYEDGAIDLAILHTAMNTGIDYWSEGAFKMLFQQYYSPDGLKYPQRGRYIYSHKEGEEAVFSLIRKKCKRVVWIGLHNLTRWHLELRTETEWSPTYKELADAQNKWYSTLVTDYLALPQEDSWVDEACYPDEFLHYIGPGVQYILDGLDPIVQDVIKS